MERVQGVESRNLWRTLIWGGAAVLFILPGVAMRLTNEVVWTASDFVVWAAMLLVASTAAEVALQKAANFTALMAGMVAVAAGFFTVWANLAVGIIGNEADPHNVPFLLVPIVAIVGAFVAGLNPRKMVLAMIAVAAFQLVAALFAISDGRVDQGARLNEIVLATVFMPGLWLLSALLYKKAA